MINADIENDNIDNLAFKSKNSIPSKVIFNQIKSIYMVINNDNDRYNMKNNLKFRNLRESGLDGAKLFKIKDFLFNGWNTEVMLNYNSLFTNQIIYKSALQWIFPQMYYSIYMSINAILFALDRKSNNHKNTINSFNGFIPDYFPKFFHYSLDKFNNNKKEIVTNSLKTPSTISDAECIINSLLNATRQLEFNERRQNLHKNIKRLAKCEKEKLDAELSKTTILNYIYRLRIKSNYYDISSFLHADFYGPEMHSNILYITDYFKFVSEVLVAKRIGINNYKVMVSEYLKIEKSDSIKKRTDSIEACFL